MKLAMVDVIDEPVCYAKQYKMSMTSQDDCGINVRCICVLTGNDSSGSNYLVDNMAKIGSSTFKCSICLDENCK